MPEPIAFTIPGKPIAKGRPRFTRNGHTYTPQRTQDYEAHVAQTARDAMNGADPLDGPVSVSMKFVLKPPTAMRKAQREAAISSRAPAENGSDVDNLAKAVLDAMNAITYRDDRQISRLSLTKEYGAEPKVEVLIQKDAAIF